jgi:hypothetical protein
MIIEIQCMWNVKAKVISVITGTIGTLSKSFTDSTLCYILGKHKIKELQKTAILGTEHEFQKVLM